MSRVSGHCVLGAMLAVQSIDADTAGGATVSDRGTIVAAEGALCTASA